MSNSQEQRSNARMLNTEPDLTANDPYLILGLSRTASQVEIKRTYFELIRQYPPETEPEKFKIIRAAYEKIKDVTRRAETDIFLPQAPPDWQPSAFKVAPDKAFYASDVRLLLRHWGELDRTNSHDDFRKIDL